ncbi:MAG: protein kinase [Pseudonocardia sp.]
MPCRDVKPRNVLVTGRGGRDDAYLIDFGIARAVDATTFSRSVIGPHAYMAPEQFEGVADHRSDVYALGCVLYQTLTGRPPFERTTFPQYMHAHISAAPPWPSAERPCGRARERCRHRLRGSWRPRRCRPVRSRRRRRPNRCRRPTGVAAPCPAHRVERGAGGRRRAGAGVGRLACAAG